MSKDNTKQAAAERGGLSDRPDLEYYRPDPGCKTCKGRGWHLVQIGPDDVEKDLCACHDFRPTGAELIQESAKLAEYPAALMLAYVMGYIRDRLDAGDRERLYNQIVYLQGRE